MTYLEWKKLPHYSWKTAPISPTCQEYLGLFEGLMIFCNSPTSKARPLMSWGWEGLCEKHGQHPEAFDVCELIEGGERWE